MKGAISEAKATPPLVLVLPYPAQGHINPLIHFARRLALHGVDVRHVTVPYILKSLMGVAGHLSVPTELISDGFDESGYAQCGNVRTYLDRFEEVGSRTLAELLGRLATSGLPADWIVYDAFLPWVLDVARAAGVLGASFFPQLGTVSATYYLHYHEKLDLPPAGSEGSTLVPVPGLPSVKFADLPSFLSSPQSCPAYYDMLLNQFSNAADVILLNSVEELEAEALHAMADSIPFKPVGPMLPWQHLNPRASDERGHETNLWKPAAADDLLAWLDDKAPRSVVYVAFGSIAAVGEAEVVEMAAALRALDVSFIWVVRGGGELVEGLETGTKGRIISWCPQPEVLGHPATGCFVTHCGWNSTLEALSLGVPMVCMPRWSDQPMNAMFVEEIWGVGVRPMADDNGVIGRKEIERCVREVMVDGGEKGQQIWTKVEKWKKVIRKAAHKGGSSDDNLLEFVEKVFNKH